MAAVTQPHEETGYPRNYIGKTPDGADLYAIPGKWDGLAVKFGQHGGVTDVAIKHPPLINTDNPEWGIAGFNRRGDPVLDPNRDLQRRHGERYVALRVRLSPGGDHYLKALPLDLYRAALVYGRGEEVHQLTHVGDGTYKLTAQVSPDAPEIPDYTRWVIRELNHMNGWETNKPAHVRFTMVRVRKQVEGAAVTEKVVAQLDDKTGRLALTNPETHKTVTNLAVNPDGTYRPVSKPPAKEAAGVVHPADPRWMAEADLGHLRSSRDYRYHKIDVKDEAWRMELPKARVTAVITSPWDATLVDKAGTVEHRLKHLGKGLYKPAAQVLPGDERPNYTFVRYASDAVSRKWCELARKRQGAEPVTRWFEDPDSGFRLQQTFIWEEGAGRGMLRDPVTGDALMRLRKIPGRHNPYYVPGPWHDELDGLHQVPARNHDALAQYAQRHGYHDAGALLKDLARRGRFYRETRLNYAEAGALLADARERAHVQGQSVDITRVYRLPGRDVGLRVDFTGDNRPVVVDMLSLPEQDVFGLPESAAQAMEQYAQQLPGYTDAVDLWSDILLRGNPTEGPDGSSRYTVPGTGAELLVWPRDEAGRLTRIAIPGVSGPN